jgi:adenosylcobinamide-GDP ribazoletransferase
MGKRLVRFCTQLLFAFGFLTAFPGLGRLRVEKDDPGKSSAFFILPGLLLGFGVLLISLIPLLTPFTRAVFAVVFMLAATRGLHGDGIIDTFDGFLSGGDDREKILEAMKDSRVGALGWVGAFAVYSLKLALLREVLVHLPAGRGLALLLPPALSRGGVAFHAFVSTPARSGVGLGGSFHAGVGLREVIISVVFMELITFGVFLSAMRAPSAFLFTPGLLFFWLIWGFICRAKIGGVTGDTIGAGVELAEVLGWGLVMCAFL